ncbi:hypothetical protein C0991_012481, partial [Blastosporella zonata]
GCLKWDHAYANFQFTKKDWDKLTVLHEVLREPTNIQQTFSSKNTPTVWCIIPSLEFLIKRWESMASHSQFKDVSTGIKNGIENLKKWYRRVDNTLGAYFICLVLDPNVKDLYCCHRWEPEQYEAGLDQLGQVFDKYYIAPETSSDKAIDNTEVQARLSAEWRYGSSFLLESVQSFQNVEKASGSLRDELKQYLKSGVERADNIVKWWGHQSELKLKGDIVEALQFLKCAIHSALLFGEPPPSVMQEKEEEVCDDDHNLDWEDVESAEAWDTIFDLDSDIDT